ALCGVSVTAHGSGPACARALYSVALSRTPSRIGTFTPHWNSTGSRGVSVAKAVPASMAHESIRTARAPIGPVIERLPVGWGNVMRAEPGRIAPDRTVRGRTRWDGRR